MLTSRFLGQVAQLSSRRLCRRVPIPSLQRTVTTTCSLRNDEHEVPPTLKTSVAKYILQGKHTDRIILSGEQISEADPPIDNVDNMAETSVTNEEIDDEDELAALDELTELTEQFDDSLEENNIPLASEGIDIDEMLLTSATEDLDIEDEYYEDQSDDDIRTQVLSLALDNVPRYGWTAESIDKAVELLELSPAAAEMFKRGPLDLVLYFIEEANNTLTQHLAQQAKQTNLNTEKECADFIEQAIKTRLQMLAPYIDTWPQAVKLLASPDACQDVFENGTMLIDEILYHAGDRSVDMSWYPRRVALAGVYCTTEMYMLNDQSEQFHDTWAYLHRRMNDARTLNRAKDSLEHAAGDGLALLNAGVNTGITTFRNIMGAGRRGR